MSIDHPYSEVESSRQTRAGKRFSSNDEVLQIERELAAEGVELENRAIPAKDHPMHLEGVSDEEIRERINNEAQKENPNRQRIGHLHEMLDSD